MSPRVFALVLTVLAFTSPAVGQDDTNPYVAFYAEAWQATRIDVEKHKIQMAYNIDRKERLEDAWRHGAIPEATILDIRRQVKMDVFELQSLESRVRKSKAQLDVVKLRVASGEPVSMCGSDE